ncbi:MAG: hypothetical protein DCF16_13345 [Alphaproteobacteria bacterium]|nr:MAG: hypothetical protein DCF16_13345 [Alphaproteobacteria bacterium]
MKTLSNILAALFTAATLAACATAPDAPQRYSGEVLIWFEGQSFHADGEDAPWALGLTSDAMRELGAVYPENYAPPPASATRIVVNVEGVLAPANRDAHRYGPIGRYEHYLTITRVIDARLLRTACETHVAIVYFDVNDVAINEVSAAIIDNAVHLTQRQACNVSSVSVIGHADGAETDPAVSDRRAAAVRDALIARGMADDLITANGGGETRPDLEDGLNRNVTITIEAPTSETR